MTGDGRRARELRELVLIHPERRREDLRLESGRGRTGTKRVGPTIHVEPRRAEGREAHEELLSRPRRQEREGARGTKRRVGEVHRSQIWTLPSQVRAE